MAIHYERDDEHIVLITIDRPEAIDEALRRPGRFDREIVIGVPDERGRREILGIHTRGMPLDPDVDLDELARTMGKDPLAFRLKNLKNDRLRAVHLCEYGAQAMAVHGGLLARAAGGRAKPGLLVALRAVELHVARIDDLPGVLQRKRHRRHDDAGAAAPRLYLPVNNPLASGKNGSNPSLYSCAAGSRSFSMSRTTRLDLVTIESGKAPEPLL